MTEKIPVIDSAVVPPLAQLIVATSAEHSTDSMVARMQSNCLRALTDIQKVIPIWRQPLISPGPALLQLSNQMFINGIHEY